ncbi:MAG: Na+/proline symporter, partial [Micrococcales bacterium]|nr:Na+/proline symporter [Micrococcales bacterium]
FALGIFTRRASTVGVAIGLVGATVIAGVMRFNGSNPFAVSSVAFIATLVLGYLVSLIVPASSRNIVGLTIHTKSQDYTGATALSPSADDPVG